MRRGCVDLDRFAGRDHRLTFRRGRRAPLAVLLTPLGKEVAQHRATLVGEAARGLRASYPEMDAWVKRFQQRPAYRRALERGGPYSMAS